MARERYETVMTCPKCNNSGTASVSENDYPFMRSLDRTVVSFPKGFRIGEPSRKENVTNVICECGHVFEF